MDPLLRVETQRFNAAMAQIGKATNDPDWQRKVIDYEVTKILETTVKRTLKATVSSIKKSEQSRGDWRTYDLGRGLKKYKLTNRYPNAVWRAITVRLQASLQKKINAREFARQAWVFLADALGFTVNVTGQARAAVIAGVSNKANVRASKGGINGKYGIELENNSPLIRFSDGRQALFSAIVGRRKYFETSMRKAYVDKIKPLVERYGFTVS